MKKLLHMEAYSRKRADGSSCIAPRMSYQELAGRYGTPLLLLNCHVLEKQYRRLKRALPGLDLFYAIKTLPHRSVIETLNAAGCGFDVASCGEIDLVEECGVPAHRCIHTHPIKRPEDIERSLDYGCTTFVVDNPIEIDKFREYRDRARLLLRVGFRSPDAVVDLARKYGCPPGEVPALLKHAASAGIRIKGLSFHVGSQALNSGAHADAVRESAEIIRYCRESRLARLDILDIGGGFPAGYSREVPDIEEFCAPVRKALNMLPPDVSVIAEPGRYIAAPAVTAIASVVGKAMRGNSIWYYLDDGVYGSYSGKIFDRAEYPLEVLKKGDDLRRSVLAGPTCDSIDVIAEDLMLPELEVGDLVVGHLMGAYTMATATDFNLFPRPRIVVMGNRSSGIGESAVLEMRG